MSKEKQILQMLQGGYSQRHIAAVLHVFRNTVARTAKAASEQKLEKLPWSPWKSLKFTACSFQKKHCSLPLLRLTSPISIRNC